MVQHVLDSADPSAGALTAGWAFMGRCSDCCVAVRCTGRALSPACHLAFVPRLPWPAARPPVA